MCRPFLPCIIGKSLLAAVPAKVKVALMACVYLNFGKESLEGAWHAKVHKLISPWRNADAKRSFEKLLCKTH